MVSIITVNYNQADYTCALLDSIRRQDFRDVEVLVVDNASRDNPAARIAEQYPEVRFIRSEQNLGFAGGNNLAVREARGDLLFFINNDAEITEGCIARMVRFFEEKPRLGIVSPLICYYPELQTPNAELQTSNVDLIQYAGMTRVHPITARNRTIGNKELDRGQFAEPQPTAYAHGAAMMLRRSVLDEVGPMSEDFFLYYEELDWCERIRRAGWEVWVEPRARVYHKESVAVQQIGGLKTYYLNRNRVWFMRKHYGGWRLAGFYAFLLLVTVPKNVMAYFLKGEKENLAAFLKGVWWNFTRKST
jgi:GT2 family glycosyltransferase